MFGDKIKPRLTKNIPPISLSGDDVPEKSPPEQMWNRRKVCAHIQHELEKVFGLENFKVYAQDRIEKLRKDFSNGDEAKEKEFDDKLALILWESFGEVLEPDFFSTPKSAIYNIANRITYNLAAIGRAISPEQECEGMDKFWQAIWTALSFNSFSDILQQNFEIKDYVGTSPKSLLTIKSYEEYEERVLRLVIATKIDNIIFTRCKDVPEDFKEKRNLAWFVIPTNAECAQCIDSDIQNVFHIKVKYDLSGSVVNGLYSYVYNGLKSSLKRQSELLGGPRFGPKTIIPGQNSNTISDQAKNNTRAKIFAGIIGVVENKVGRRGILSKEKFSDLRNEMSQSGKNPDDLTVGVETFLRRKYKIDMKIGENDNDLSVYTVCDAVHKQLAERGEAEYIKVAAEDMDVLWNVINKAMRMHYKFLESVIENMFDVRVDHYKLSNCHTFYEYKRLITTALQQRAISQVKS